MEVKKIQPVDPRLLDRIRNFIHGSAKPSAIVDLLSAIPSIPERKIRLAVQQLVTQARIYKWPPDHGAGSRAARFWHTAFEVVLEKSILKTTRTHSLTRTQLVSRLKSPMFRCASSRIKSQLTGALKNLTQKGDLKAYPPFGRKRAFRYSQVPPETEPYLQPTLKAFQQVLSLWQNAGLTTQDLVLSAVEHLKALNPAKAQHPSRAPLSGPSRPVDKNPSRCILDAITTVEPAAHQEALVSIPHLRKALTLSKKVFDDSIMELAGQGRFWLHRHIDPSQLSENEKATLVTTDNETFYMGLVLRSDHD